MKKPRDKRATIRVGRHRLKVPGTKRQRVLLGTGLVAGGLVGFLPLVGFWMLPLGVAVLSVDSPRVRRAKRRLEVRWGRWRQTRSGKEDG